MLPGTPLNHVWRIRFGGKHTSTALVGRRGAMHDSRAPDPNSHG